MWWRKRIELKKEKIIRKKKKCNKEKWRWRNIEKERSCASIENESLRQMFGMEIDESHNDGMNGRE